MSGERRGVSARSAEWEERQDPVREAAECGKIPPSKNKGASPPLFFRSMLAREGLERYGLAVMQCIVPSVSSAAQYVETRAHLSVRAPLQCGNCKRAAVLESLGYYRRWVRCEASGRDLLIRVRRFPLQGLLRFYELSAGFCSALPAFAQ